MSSSSLLSFLDAPVVVGDPDGCAAYVNPAFETRFSTSAETVTGQPLASLFEGGVREAVLQAVAEVCSAGKSSRFRVRHGGIGYVGLASPIIAEDARVGFVILLSESAPEDERALKLHRQTREPLGEVSRVLDELGDADLTRRSSLIDEGMRAAERLNKVHAELGAVLGAHPGKADAGPNTFDPARITGDVAGRLSPRFAQASVGLEVRVPAALPPVPGNVSLFADALKGLLESRLEGAEPGSGVVLTARAMERDGARAVVIAVVDRQGAGAESADLAESEPIAVRRAVQALGGELRTTSDPSSGRVTAIRLVALKL